MLQNTKLHYVEAGCRSNPTVLLLHGFPDCWFGWRYQVSYTLLAPDIHFAEFELTISMIKFFLPDFRVVSVLPRYRTGPEGIQRLG